MLVIFSALGAAAVLLDIQTLAAGVAGVWFGEILRDLGFFRQIVKIWPYDAGVLDWALIDRLAAGEPAEKTARWRCRRFYRCSASESLNSSSSA